MNGTTGIIPKKGRTGYVYSGKSADQMKKYGKSST